MNPINTGGPAFPCKVYMGDRWNQQTQMSEPQYLEQPGAVTLRDYFAAKAMQALFDSDAGHSLGEMMMIAKESYAMADAMLAAREKGGDA